MERTVRTKDGSVIRAHLMSREDKGFLPETIDLSLYDSIPVTGSILKEGEDSLPGYLSLIEFRSGEEDFWLLSSESVHEIWSTEETLDLLLPAESFLVTESGRTFPVTQLALHAEEGRVMVHFREKGKEGSRYVERKELFIERLESKDLDTSGVLLAMDGEPMPGNHSLREEKRNGISEYFLDGSPVSGMPLMIRKEDMRTEDVSGEFLMAGGKLIEGITEASSFDIEGMPWLRIVSRKGTLFMKSTDLTIIHKDSFHPMETENLIIRDKNGKSLTDTMKTLCVSNEDGIIWFLHTTITGNTRLISADDISIITPDSTEYIDPCTCMAFREGTVIQNIDKILKLQSEENGTCYKLLYANGLSEVYRNEEIEVLKKEKDEKLASTGARLSAGGTDIWDFREIRRVEAEGKAFILAKASSGAIRIWNEEDTEISLDVSGDCRIKEKLGTPLSFIPEKSVLARTLMGTAQKREPSPFPLIIPFSPDTAEVKASETVLDESLAVLELPSSAETVLNLAANLLLKGESVEIVTENPDIERLLEECGLTPHAAVFKDGKPLSRKEEESFPARSHDMKRMEEKARALIEDLLMTESREDELRANSEERKALLERKEELKATTAMSSEERRSFLVKASDLEEILDRVRNFGSGAPSSFIREMLRKDIGSRAFWKKERKDLVPSLELILTERKLLENKNRDTELRTFLQRHRAGRNREFMEDISLTMLKESLYERTKDFGERTMTSEDIMFRSALVRKEFPLVITDRTDALKKVLFDTVIIDRRLGRAGLAAALAEAENAVIFRENI